MLENYFDIFNGDIIRTQTEALGGLVGEVETKDTQNPVGWDATTTDQTFQKDNLIYENTTIKAENGSLKSRLITYTPSEKQNVYQYLFTYKAKDIATQKTLNDAVELTIKRAWDAGKTEPQTYKYIFNKGLRDKDENLFNALKIFSSDFNPYNSATKYYEINDFVYIWDSSSEISDTLGLDNTGDSLYHIYFKDNNTTPEEQTYEITIKDASGFPIFSSFKDTNILPRGKEIDNFDTITQNDYIKKGKVLYSEYKIDNIFTGTGEYNFDLELLDKTHTITIPVTKGHDSSWSLMKIELEGFGQIGNTSGKTYEKVEGLLQIITTHPPPTKTFLKETNKVKGNYALEDIFLVYYDIPDNKIYVKVNGQVYTSADPRANNNTSSIRFGIKLKLSARTSDFIYNEATVTQESSLEILSNIGSHEYIDSYQITEINGKIKADTLEVGAISGGAITGGAITGTSLNTSGGAITGGAINGTSLDTSGGAITGGAINGTSLDTSGGAITGGAITGTSLNTSGGAITGGAITGTSLNTSGKITASNFEATTNGGLKISRIDDTNHLVNNIDSASIKIEDNVKGHQFQTSYHPNNYVSMKFAKKDGEDISGSGITINEGANYVSTYADEIRFTDKANNIKAKIETNGTAGQSTFKDKVIVEGDDEVNLALRSYNGNKSSRIQLLENSDTNTGQDSGFGLEYDSNHFYIKKIQGTDIQNTMKIDRGTGDVDIFQDLNVGSNAVLNGDVSLAKTDGKKLVVGAYNNSGGRDALVQVYGGQDGDAKIELKEYVGTNDVRGFNVMYEGSSSSDDFKIQRNENGLDDVDALTIKRRTGVVNIPNTTTSTSTTSGALTVGGGVGVKENLNVGSNANITRHLTVGENATLYKGKVHFGRYAGDSSGFVIKNDTLSDPVYNIVKDDGSKYYQQFWNNNDTGKPFLGFEMDRNNDILKLQGNQFDLSGGTIKTATYTDLDATVSDLDATVSDMEPKVTQVYTHGAETIYNHYKIYNSFDYIGDNDTKPTRLKILTPYTLTEFVSSPTNTGLLYLELIIQRKEHEVDTSTKISGKLSIDNNNYADGIYSFMTDKKVEGDYIHNNVYAVTEPISAIQKRHFIYLYLEGMDNYSDVLGNYRRYTSVFVNIYDEYKHSIQVPYYFETLQTVDDVDYQYDFPDDVLYDVPATTELDTKYNKSFPGDYKDEINGLYVEGENETATSGSLITFPYTTSLESTIWKNQTTNAIDSESTYYIYNRPLGFEFKTSPFFDNNNTKHIKRHKIYFKVTCSATYPPNDGFTTSSRTYQISGSPNKTIIRELEGYLLLDGSINTTGNFSESAEIEILSNDNSDTNSNKVNIYSEVYTDAVTSLSGFIVNVYVVLGDFEYYTVKERQRYERNIFGYPSLSSSTFIVPLEITRRPYDCRIQVTLGNINKEKSSQFPMELFCRPITIETLTSQNNETFTINSSDDIVSNNPPPISMGVSSGIVNPPDGSILIGRKAGYSNALNDRFNNVAIGTQAGMSNQGNRSVAIGENAGKDNQGRITVAIGEKAGESNQTEFSVGIGSWAGQSNQGQSAVAIGRFAGKIEQGQEAVAIGINAGETSQSIYGVAIGSEAGKTSQGNYGVAIGRNAGNVSQSQFGVGIGPSAGHTSQGDSAVAIGRYTGVTNQGDYAVSIGKNAAVTSQGDYAVAIGNHAGDDNQKYKAIAIGYEAGKTRQGSNAIAIGNAAGNYEQPDNSIILNAKDDVFNAGNEGFFVKPIRGRTSSNKKVLYYDTTTGEISYLDANGPS